MSSILFVTSEVYPLIKTGGLADVAASLPRALLKQKHDVRILLPAYESVLANPQVQGIKTVATLDIDGKPCLIKQTRLPGTRVTVWLVDIPEFSERVGNPYCGADGNDWPDNHLRFYWFAKAAELIALDQAGLDWQPEVVHCNDWQTGLVPALLSLHQGHPATVFTIHNLAYRGLFSYQAFAELDFPPAFWHHERLEFYGQMSYMKGGLAFADYITTVSPSYAHEIQLPEHGYGLDGLIRYRKDSLSGILNGIDCDEWNPGTDQHIPTHYNRRTIAQKVKNKVALQESMGLAVSETTPLIGFIGRLIDQKGVDLIMAQLQPMLALDCQMVILGSGFPHYEQKLRDIAAHNPERVAVTIGYNESLAHLIEAGCDIFLMPSIFEPCGLNQMYSLRYGTLPVVHAIGGLKDTVREFPLDALEDAPAQEANGFVFHSPEANELHAAIGRAIHAYHQPKAWKKLQLNAMNQDFSWEQSAQSYVDIYTKLLES